MRFVTLPSFERRYKKLPAFRQEAVREAIFQLIDIVERRAPLKAGLGLKHLKEDLWEIRSTIRDRIVFNFHSDSIELVFVGNHDDIHAFLKQ